MFAFETLEFLQRNGRIGRGQALVGGLLGVRPLLTLVEGEVEPLGQACAATRACWPSSSGWSARTRAPTSGCASASRTPRPRAIANDIAETVRSARPQAVIELVAPLGAVVGTNTGPGGAGLVWAREPG